MFRFLSFIRAPFAEWTEAWCISATALRLHVPIRNVPRPQSTYIGTSFRLLQRIYYLGAWSFRDQPTPGWRGNGKQVQGVGLLRCWGSLLRVLVFRGLRKTAARIQDYPACYVFCRNWSAKSPRPPSKLPCLVCQVEFKPTKDASEFWPRVGVACRI